MKKRNDTKIEQKHADQTSNYNDQMKLEQTHGSDDTEESPQKQNSNQ